MNNCFLDAFINKKNKEQSFYFKFYVSYLIFAVCTLCSIICVSSYNILTKK